MEKHLINANCACRVHKGTDYAIKLLRNFMANHYKRFGINGYFLKLDVKKYFPSINHEVLYEKLKKFEFDEKTEHLLHIIIDSYGNGIGLPMGNQSSQCFALLYLDRIDRIIKERLKVRYYVRYMDDMIMLFPDKQSAASCFEYIAEEIKKEKIELNYKSQLISLKNGVEFLGWRFSFGDNGKIIQKVKNQSKKRIFKKYKKRLYESCKRSSLIKNLENSIASYKGHLSRGNGWKVFQKIKRITKKYDI